MTQNRAEMGFSAFLRKMGISTNDRMQVTGLLAGYALSQYDRVVALRKFPTEIKPIAVRIITSYAFEDYARGAASRRQYPYCHGKKLIEGEVFTNKIQYPDGKPPVRAKYTKGMYPSYWEEQKKVREVVKIAYPECGGKGEVSTVCKDCRGYGATIHREESVKHGMPITRDCQRCGNRGCERLPPAGAFNATYGVTSAIILDTWKRSVKRSYDTLMVRFDIEKA